MRAALIVSLLVSLLGSLTSSTVAGADPDPDPGADPDEEGEGEEDPYYGDPRLPRFERNIALTGGWGGVRKYLAQRGLSFDAIYTAEIFGAAARGGLFQTAGLALLGIDLELGVVVAPRLGAFHVSGVALHGDDLTEDLEDVFTVSNITGHPEARLFEAWYEQPLGPLSIRAGLLAVDQEYLLAENGHVLVNATFGISSQVPAVAAGPYYPIAAPGIRARVEHDVVTARVGVFDGDPTSTRGVPTKLGDELLLFAEVELAGLLELGIWRHTRDGAGYYASVDARLGRPLGAFARVGVAPDLAVDLYADAGVRLGPMFERDFASAGIAFARTPDGHEVVAELTYQRRQGWLIFQPDLQILMQRTRTSVILGARVIVVL